MLWLFVHILYLIGFRNRLMVLINWFWSYVFFDRAVRVSMPGCCECPTEQVCKRRGPGPEHDAERLRVID